jgi:hypothetical protein
MTWEASRPGEDRTGGPSLAALAALGDNQKIFEEHTGCSRRSPRDWRTGAGQNMGEKSISSPREQA